MWEEKVNSVVITWGSECAHNQTVALSSSLHPHHPERRTKLIGCGETPSHAAVCGVAEAREVGLPDSQTH